MIAAIVSLLGGWRATAFAALAALALAWGGAEHYRVNSAHAALATLQAEQARQETEDAKALAESQAKARAAEQAQAEAIAKIAAEYERGKTDAQSVADRVAAGLRDGTVRLRRELTGCQAGRMQEASARAGEPARAPVNGSDLAGAAVGAGARCDATVRALQAIVLSDRQ